MGPKWSRSKYARPDLSVFWVDARNPQRFKETYIRIGKEARLPSSDDPDVNALARVEERLDRRAYGRWLMIVDNANDLALFGHEDSTSPKFRLGSALEDDLCRYIPDKPHWDSESRTPLSRAAEKGHEAVVKLLLATEKVDVDSKNSRWGRTPLSWAAENGHEAVVKLLLVTQKVDIDSKDEYRRMQLSWAECYGMLRPAYVGRAVTYGQGLPAAHRRLAEPRWASTPWARAAGAVRPHSVIACLYSFRPPPTPLPPVVGSRSVMEQGHRCSSEKGHEAVVKLLLATQKAGMDSKDSDWGRTPLSFAAENGHEVMVRLLQSHYLTSSPPTAR
ncbi:hypothetical protein GP486_001060 [Trichoglossum hirsutum]|uniref:Ankyrin repeat protein n=1 Tax=Trichoglossum hirsutum TaxID=265104 RepID=A0A9P8RTE1_9PEZI|nr:hypothetical protein GP486_001060 [Trichoglossum hirsutum]